MVSSSGLGIYAQAALVLFFLTFLAVVVWAWQQPRCRMDQAARLPLEEGPLAPLGKDEARDESAPR
ncbi:MAG TPA: hypothetical protein VF184_01530 [Phycisphaeraceae bacterium]